MGKKSVKKNKKPYQLRREELNLSREQASELLESIQPERIFRIENEVSLPQPEEVMIMAEKYKMPDLCNYYCSNECPIGQQYVPEIKIEDLSKIVLKMVAALNAASKEKDRLIEITVDGTIDADEIKDFVCIQDELENISVTVEALQLWAERMIVNGHIDMETYNSYKKVRE